MCKALGGKRVEKFMELNTLLSCLEQKWGEVRPRDQKVIRNLGFSHDILFSQTD